MQPGGTARAYKAFTLYRDLGSNRTLQQVASSLSLSVSRIAQLSRAHNWKERVRAWVQEQDRQQQEALAEYRWRILTQHLSLAEGMRNAAYHRVQLLIGDPEHPDFVNLQEQLAVKDIARLVAVACDIERWALYPPKEQHQPSTEIHISIEEENRNKSHDSNREEE